MALSLALHLGMLINGSSWIKTRLYRSYGVSHLIILINYRANTIGHHPRVKIKSMSREMNVDYLNMLVFRGASPTLLTNSLCALLLPFGLNPMIFCASHEETRGH